jgi:hypothetical protein
MNGFVEECRQEWKRLGVPDPIANEMAFDLSADIEEAEAEGGSAEDVLGNSLFDPRRFAAAWASARGVTSAPPALMTVAPVARGHHAFFRPSIVVALAVFGLLAALAAVALAVGGRGAASVARGIVSVPGSVRLRGPVSVARPFRNFVFGPSLSAHGAAPFVALGFGLLIVGIIFLGLVILYWAPWPGRDPKRRLW